MRSFLGWKFGMFLTLVCFTSLLSAPSAPSSKPEIEQHIQHVTSGLIGEVVIKGGEIVIDKR